MAAIIDDRTDITLSKIKMEISEDPPIVGYTEEQIKDGQTKRRERRKKERLCKKKR